MSEAEKIPPRRQVKRQRIDQDGDAEEKDRKTSSLVDPSLGSSGDSVLPEGLLKFKLNGNVVEKSCSLTRPLAWTLRETFDLHGTKVACGQGNCGACTILVKSPDEDEAKPVNACLFATGSLLMSKDSSHAAEQMFEVTTIEGVDNNKTDSDHECFSKAIVEANGTQCGFCTAGMIMKVEGCTKSKKGCSEVTDIEDMFNGNLCRCTGYRPILYAAKKTYLPKDDPHLKKENDLTPPCVVRGEDRDYSKTYSNRSLSHPNVSQSVPLEKKTLAVVSSSDEEEQPDDIQMLTTMRSAPSKNRSIDFEMMEDTVKSISSKFESMAMRRLKNCLLPACRAEWHDKGPKDHVHVPKKSEWRNFSTLDEFWTTVRASQYRDFSFRLVAGNANQASNRIDDAADTENVMFVSLLNIKELKICNCDDISKISIGSALSMSTFNEKVLKPFCPQASSHLKTVANIQVRNLGTIGGNLSAARNYGKTSDIGLILSALDATVDVEYFTKQDYKKIVRENVPIWDFLKKDNEVLIPDGSVWVLKAIHLDLSAETLKKIDPYFSRIGQRVQNHPSIASVAATSSNLFVTEAHCPKDYVKIWKCDIPTDPSAKDLLDSIKKADMDTGYFTKDGDDSPLRTIFHLALQARLLRSQTLLAERVEKGQIGSQKFMIDVKASPVTEPIIKPNAYDLTTGSAIYTQDARRPRDCLEATFVLSPTARTMFDTSAFNTEGQAIADKMVGPGVAILLTAEACSEVAKSSKRRADELGIALRQKSDFDFLKINGNDSTRFNKPQPFGEFIVAKGDTGSTFCGQPIAMVLHPELTESRRIARHIQKLVDNWDTPDKTQLTASFRSETPILRLEDSVENSAKNDTRLPSTILGRGDFIKDLDKEKLQAYTNIRESGVSIDEWIWDWSAYEKNEDYLVIDKSEIDAPSQYHMYLETQTAMCSEVQRNVFEVHASTQSATSIQSYAAGLLGVLQSNVTVKNNLIGGGFGGKEPQSIPVAAAASFACAATGRPVRVMNDRQIDMKMIGKRHAMNGKYRVCIHKKTAKIVAMDLVLNGDAGASKSVSGPVLELAALVSDNAYGIENFMVRATPYLTNKATGTAFRSFGVVQTVQLTETAIQHAWDAVRQENLSQISAEDFRKKHFSVLDKSRNPPRAPLRYNKYAKDWTDYGQSLIQFKNMPKIWGEIMGKYKKVEKECQEWNKTNRWRKRGVAVLPLRYGISFTFLAGNQGNARVAIYSRDGSVLVDHSGIEMGQGLIARATVACAAELGVPMHFIRVGSFSTYNSPNAPGTGASTGTALSIPGVVQAAQKLRDTLTGIVNKQVDDALAKHVGAGLGLDPLWRNDPLQREKAVALLNDPNIVRIGRPTELWKNADAKNPLALYTLLGDSWKIPVPKDETKDDAKNRIAMQTSLWTQFVSSAYSQRKSLISLGYSTPTADGSETLGSQNLFYYFNYAAAFSYVEVDCITGELSVLRTDVHYDCGLSHNPAIDVGQVEGGFVQGLGNMLTESVTYNEKTGALEENSTLTYAIPDHRSIPQEFNIVLTWEGGSKPLSAEDTRTIQEKAAKVNVDKISRSKSTGEPPLVLASSVLFAARNAVREARKDHLEKDDWLQNFNAPLLPPRMLEALWGEGTCLQSRHPVQSKGTSMIDE